MCDRDAGLTDISSFLAEKLDSAVTEPHASTAINSASRMTVLEIEVIPAMCVYLLNSLILMYTMRAGILFDHHHHHYHHVPLWQVHFRSRFLFKGLTSKVRVQCPPGRKQLQGSRRRPYHL